MTKFHKLTPDEETAYHLDTVAQGVLDGTPAARATAKSMLAHRVLREALRDMLRHSCVADADPRDKDAQDHDAERKARAALTEAGEEGEL